MCPLGPYTAVINYTHIIAGTHPNCKHHCEKKTRNNRPFIPPSSRHLSLESQYHHGPWHKGFFPRKGCLRLLQLQVLTAERRGAIARN